VLGGGEGKAILLIAYRYYYSQMNQVSFSSLFRALVLGCGLALAASSSHNNERRLRPDQLSENWEQEEALAALLYEKIVASKSASPTNPIVSS
jgi:hypothetical protein